MKAGVGRSVLALVVVCLLPLALSAQNAELISINSAGTDSGNFGSQLNPFAQMPGQRTVSADGRFVVFSSSATNLVSGLTDANGTLNDVFVRDRLTGVTTLVSINSAGTASGNAVSFLGVISANGTHVVFRSQATDLVASPVVTGTNNQCYARNLVTNTTTLVSINSAGTDAGDAGTGSCDVPTVNANRVAFTATASDLVGTDTNGMQDVFVRDLIAGTTTLVSVNSGGADSGNATSYVPTISNDGNRIAFLSEATDLVPGFVDGNGPGFGGLDAYVRDLGAGTTTLVSINSAGTASANVGVGSPSISGDGNFVAFSSTASDLVATDTNGAFDIFVRNLMAGATDLVTINSAGTDSGNGAAAGGAALSPDGRFVAFVSAATDLVAGFVDGNGPGIFDVDVFVRDRMTATTTLASINSAGTASGNDSSSLVTPYGVSADGSVVVFGSLASDLVPTDTNGGLAPASDVFVRNLTAGTTTLASVNSTGTDSGNGGSFVAQISDDGSTVVFGSSASNLVATDTNGSGDVFAFALAPLAAPDISIDDVSVAEGNAGTTVATFTVSLSAPSASTVTVDFITNGVTATSGSDFVAGSGTVTFLPSDVSEPVTITINGDTLDELDETFTVDLSNPTNATILDGQGVGTITDDDGQDFTLTTAECCFECVAGGKARFNLTLAPVSTPVTSPVALSCSGLPSLSTCTFTPASVTPGSSPANAVMLIETAGTAGSPGAALQTQRPIYALWLGGAGLGLVGLMVAGRGGRRRKARAGVAALLTLFMLSCASSSPSTPPGTYTISITATGSNFTHTFDVKLIVTD